MQHSTVLITGTGDEASATAIRLFRAGFNVLMVARQKTIDLHYHRNFTRAIYAGQSKVEEVLGLTFSQAFQQNLITTQQSVFDFIKFAFNNRQIPLIFFEELRKGQKLPVKYVVRLDENLYQNVKSFLPDDVCIIGFQADAANNYWVSKNQQLWGQVQYPFLAEKEIKTLRPVLKAQKIVESPLAGVFVASKEINDHVIEREEIGKIDAIPILSPYTGTITGIINSGVLIDPHTPLIEITTGRSAANARVLPMEAFALAGGVLEAILFDLKSR